VSIVEEEANNKKEKSDDYVGRFRV